MKHILLISLRSLSLLILLLVPDYVYCNISRRYISSSDTIFNEKYRQYDDDVLIDTVTKSRENVAIKEKHFNAFEYNDSLNRYKYILGRRYRTYGDSFSKKWSDHLFIEIGAGLEKMAAY